jgi:hypothetical protein
MDAHDFFLAGSGIVAHAIEPFDYSP